MTRVSMCATALVVGMVLAGCSAKVNDLRPKHAVICPGDHVDVVWDVTGSATLEIRPPLLNTPAGPVASRGRVTLAPTAPRTTVFMHVSSFSGAHAEAASEIEIDTGELVNGSVANPSARCENGILTTIARLSPESFASDVVVAKIGVEGNDSQTYAVTHGGRQTTVGPGRMSTVLAGLPIAGEWTIATASSCVPESLPNNLPIRVFTKCAVGAQP